MTRNSFDVKLQLLHQDLLNMSNKVEEQIKGSIEALKNRSMEMALQIINTDNLIDSYEREIEEKCVKLIAIEQPMAVDLRRIFVTSQTVTDLERMGDHAVDMAKLAIDLRNEEYITDLVDIPEMAGVVSEMLKKSVEVYITKNVQLAHEVCSMDNQVDRYYETIFGKVIEAMLSNKEVVYQGSRFLFVCKYLERIADHVTNICEQTLYLETGERLKLN